MDPTFRLFKRWIGLRSDVVNVCIRVYLGVIKPRVNILGQELSGEVEVVGKNVTKFK